MNLVFVDGGTKFLREVAHRTVAFCIDELMPESNNVNFHIQLQTIKSEATGYAGMGDNRREYILDIDKNQTLREFISTICHEMVHVKQYFYKEMDDTTNDDGDYRWHPKGGEATVISKETLYSELPWEVEAYDLQYKLADQIWEKNIV
jgi:hypothetical protein